jgi:hypothetical protein
MTRLLDSNVMPTELDDMRVLREVPGLLKHTPVHEFVKRFSPPAVSCPHRSAYQST